MLLFDTYAFVEIIKGSENYRKYIESEFITNKFIIAELCYWLTRNYGKEISDNYI